MHFARWGVISFHSLVSGSVGVRFTRIDGVDYLSIRDIIMVVCGKDNNDAGQIWRRLPEMYKNEVQDWILKFQFPGRGQSSQPVITLQGALKLIMWLPGDMAKEFRGHACDILARYFEGDSTLTIDIAHNASIGPLAACNQFINDVLTSAKRKREYDVDVEYVYATESDAFPGHVKIGRTGDLDARLVSMNTSCAPKPHRYVAIAPTYHAVRDEKIVHSFFDDVRAEGEFFRTSVNSVRRVFDRYVTAEFNDELRSRLN